MGLRCIRDFCEVGLEPGFHVGRFVFMPPLASLIVRRAARFDCGPAGRRRELETIGKFRKHSIRAVVICPGVGDKDDWITTVAD